MATLTLIVGDEDGRVAIGSKTPAASLMAFRYFNDPVYFQQQPSTLKFGRIGHSVRL